MIEEDKVIVIDVDGTLCDEKQKGQNYIDLKPNSEMVLKLRKYKDKGFYIVMDTARNMRTHQGNIGRINADTLKTMLKWLDMHEIPYDEVHVGKPWAGARGFYVDDRTIRPSEFLEMSYEEIMDVTGRNKK